MTASFLQRLLHTWSLPLLWRGFRTALTPSLLWPLPSHLTSSRIVPHFESKQEEAKEKIVKQTEKPSTAAEGAYSVLPVLARAFGKDLAFVACLELITTLCLQTSPMVMRLLIAFAKTGPERTPWHGQLFAFLLFFLATSTVLIISQNLKCQFTIGMQIRSSLTSALYKKSLRLSPEARKESTVGEVVNLMSADVNSIVMLGQHINFLWGCPLQIIAATAGLYMVVGWPALVGVSSLLVGTPLTLILAKFISGYMTQQMKIKDKRLRILSEIITGMKVLKLFAWEMPFMGQVLEKRNEETHVMKRKACLGALVSFLWTMIPFMVGFVAFACYYTTGRELTAEQAFVTLAYLYILRFPMTMLGILIPWVLMTKVSLTRINKFLNQPELTPDPSGESIEKREEALWVTNGSFKWGLKEAPVLQKISLSLKAGSLTAVVGKVGAGKSSLLSALLGDMHLAEGSVGRHGTMAYVPQQAWVQNCSLRDNILFCQELQPARYQEVMESCALLPDLEVMPDGDLTELGERGITLSGGQKQRVSLARAAYSGAEVVLLDDPLAAVDAHVGRHIFDKVLGPGGLLEGRTRLLVTHSLTYLCQCDQVIVMAEGRVVEQGTYQELLTKEGGQFAKFLADHTKDSQAQCSLVCQEGQTSLPSKDCAASQPEVSKHFNVHSPAAKEEAEVREPLLQHKIEPEEEKLETGRVKLAVYMSYLTALGPWGCASILLTLAMTAGAEAATSWWVKVWTDSNNSTEASHYLTNLGYYGGLGLLQSTLVMAYSTFLVFTTLRGSKRLHRNMLTRVMRSPMSFFEKTPLGRIINRFGKDIDACDNILPETIKQLLLRSMRLFTLSVIITLILPMALLVLVPAALCFTLLQQGVVRSLRQLQRLDSVSRSPIYSHFSESLAGASVIRAYARQPDFVQRSEQLLDASQRCYYPGMVADQLLAVSLGLLGNLVTLVAALLTTTTTVSPGSVGLVLSSCLQIPQMLAEVVRMSAQLESNIVAVERICEYSQLGQEAAWLSEQGATPGAEWPQQGKVEVRGLTLRYQEDRQPALRQVSCTLEAGQMVGVVGRTGAGKSSLAAALFRLVEPESGVISIDGVDISTIGLHDLRSKLTIIPQDPVLFAGSLRINLDPFTCFPDGALWEALEKAHLQAWAVDLEKGLEHEVLEGGENLSVGQRQLVCLARALLTTTRLLVLDEATASVDLATDALIQATLRREFRGSTVITIAHRIATILDYDKVLVLEQGRLLEEGRPSDLLRDGGSTFYGMAREAGVTENT